VSARWEGWRPFGPTADGVHVSDGQTGQNADWSERYAETGGWPPPAADQRRYEPGPNPAGPADGDPIPGPDATGSGPGPAGTPDGYGHGPGPAATPDGYGPGPAAYGGAPAPGRWDFSEPAPHWGQPANQSGGPGPWAPGDSAYGRLSSGGPARTPPQRPRRPWDNRPAGRRRAGGGTPITIGLIVACVIIFLLQQADPTITVRYGLVPYLVEQGQWERLITAAFLHANVLHLATNMLTLYIVGAPLERVLRTSRYLLIYVLSALGGSLLSLALSPQFSNGVGASGAIFGLFGALLILRRKVGAEASGLVVLIGLNLFISFAVPNISWQAHIGGLVTGVVVALALQAADRVRRRPAG
jgi:membrane associated rhomboid family serine protease